MKFEEQFPELKEKTVIPPGFSTETGYLFVEDIKQHCLSKQRVKEAIEKLVLTNEEELNIIITLLENLGLNSE